MGGAAWGAVRPRSDADVRLHRRIGDLDAWRHGPVPVSGPERTVVDCALRASLVERVQLMEHVLRAGHTTRDRLLRHLERCHLYGVVAAREAFAYVRERSESPWETWLRLLLALSGLPEPDANVEVRTEGGSLVARVDLLHARWKVVVEYDGRHHETDRAQWARDRRRREALEALGYRVVVVAAADAHLPRDVVRRVHRALAQRGYDGPRPWSSASWCALFT
jgi:hypothetical protein